LLNEVPHSKHNSSEALMKALVYQGPSKKAREERPIPEIQAAGDAIVQIVKTTICGTDLHILKGESRPVRRAASPVTRASASSPSSPPA
jgi:D-arabinose 1-dehydrogenase-like Zn-dependent alcohol dehydrogenase